ncbi:uncharacterized protein LOC108682865, partial [Hyalella azteca]|uniref:Uncharacterized protein LOC108682865 n=1 Tax=Hyalella azteca TaxID=294128 RepID=A0A8B7PNN0_HYAAZ
MGTWVLCLAVVVLQLAQLGEVEGIFSSLGGFASTSAATSVGLSAANAAVAAGAAAVAAAGIAGLGIAAIAFKSVGSKGRGGNQGGYAVYQYGYHDGYGGNHYNDLHHYHHGGGYGSGYHRRRSIRAAEDPPLVNPTVEDERQAQVVGMVAAMDPLGCGL